MRVHIALTLRSRYDRVPPRKGVRGYGDLASVDMGGWRATCYKPVTRVRGAHRLDSRACLGGGHSDIPHIVGSIVATSGSHPLTGPTYLGRPSSSRHRQPGEPPVTSLL